MGGTLQEREAIRQCQAGELAALGVLFELHQQAVFRTAYSIVRRHDDAEDVTQDVFIELFKAIKRYDVKRPFSAWLHGIAVHRSLDRIRRRKDHSPIEEVLDLPSLVDSPEVACEKTERRAAIWNAIGKLSPKHRAAVVLRYYHGFSEAEMAVALRCRRGAVKSRLHYALRHLGDDLGPELPPPMGISQPPPKGPQGNPPIAGRIQARAWSMALRYQSKP